MTKLFASLLFAAALLPAQAATLQPEKSDVTFTFKQMGVPVDGKFKKFEAQLDFDAKKPEAGKIAFTVDLGSVSLGDPSFDKELAGATWFDTKRNGKATFVSTGIKATGPGKYDVAGKLTIKGSVRDVTVPVQVVQSGPTSTATGKLQRTARTHSRDLFHLPTGLPPSTDINRAPTAGAVR
mgnify:CR=1 FL=1